MWVHRSHLIVSEARADDPDRLARRARADELGALPHPSRETGLFIGLRHVTGSGNECTLTNTRILQFRYTKQALDHFITRKTNTHGDRTLYPVHRDSLPHLPETLFPHDDLQRLSLNRHESPTPRIVV